MRILTFDFSSISKIIEYLKIVFGIYLSEHYRGYSFKIALAATMSSFFMIVGFISAVKGVQFLSGKEFVEILGYQVLASQLYIPCAICVSVAFALNGELKYRQESYIEDFKLAVRENVLSSCSQYYSFVQSSDIPFQNPVFYSNIEGDRVKAFSLMNGVVHRTSLGLSNVIPSIVLMVLVLLVMTVLSAWLTLGIIIGVIPIALYLIFSVKKNDLGKIADKKTLEDYNFGVKDFFEQKITKTHFLKVVKLEFERTKRLRMEVCKREYFQAYWANASLFFVVAVGLYALNNGSLDIGSLILYILSIRWFISSTIRTLNNAHTIGLSREGCFYIYWALTQKTT